MPAVHTSSQDAAAMLPARMAAGATTVTTPALRYWRTQRALLQDELAELAGVHPASVQRGEHNAALRLDVIRRLAAALQVEPADLMGQPPAG